MTVMASFRRRPLFFFYVESLKSSTQSQDMCTATILKYNYFGILVYIRNGIGSRRGIVGEVPLLVMKLVEDEHRCMILRGGKHKLWKGEKLGWQLGDMFPSNINA